MYEQVINCKWLDKMTGNGCKKRIENGVMKPCPFLHNLDTTQIPCCEKNDNDNK